jgi:hypothetical protein
MRLALALVALLFFAPAAALAQSAGGNAQPPVAGNAQSPSGRNLPPTPANLVRHPNQFPHPVFPWNSLTRPEIQGTPVAYIPVSPQEVTITVAAPTPAGLPIEWRQEVVTIPGYLVTETTTGYLYPERWTLDQLNLGVYQWRLLPAEFRPK